jgi:eukaryotic-like serine/threonine-protein kinase
MPIVGDVLADRYRIESVLGVGGMAAVYRATDLRLDRQVAVKVLAANLAADPQFAERFNREAGAMASFSHPNVAAVYDVEPGEPSTGREPFYVMEYCEGGSLADRLKAGPIPPVELVPIVTATSDGLDELHRHGLIHRDVKPANILFSGDRAKLADFGVARSEGPHDRTPLTLPGSTLGTLPYLAPELVAGGSPSAASDVYALGVTIFQALTGLYPKGVPVSVAAPDLGTGFDAAMARALDEDPAARPSPTGLAAQLATGLGLSGVARPNPGAMAVDLEAQTVVAVGPPPAAAPVARPERPMAPVVAPPAARRPTPRRPRAVRSGGTNYLGLAIFVAALLVAVLALPRLLGGGGGLPSASSAAPTGTSATPTALPSSAATVLAALDQVDAAIEAARGGKDGLSGRDANELAQLAGTVRQDVNRGDLGAATTAAQALSDRARELTAHLDKKLRDPLLAAIDALLQALSAS